MEKRRWYIIQTYSGFENSIKEDLERRIESMGMQDLIFQVMIPEEKTIETKTDGTKKEKMRKMFPGYVFVEMIVTDESWFVVRNTPKVTGFLGSSGGGTKPVPLPPDEINYILVKLGKIEKITYSVGEVININTGPFANMQLPITEVDAVKEIVIVQVKMFGRETPVELSYNQISKIN